jgi:two-component system sensor histidine kinase MprB
VTFRVRLTLLFVLSLAILGAVSSTITYVIVRDRFAAQDAHAATQLADSAAVAEPEGVELDRLAAAQDAIWLLDRRGEVVAKTFRAGGTDLTEVRALVRQATGNGMVSAEASASDGGQAIVLHSTAQTQSALATVRRTLIIVDILAVALAAVAGAVLASRALRPVERMQEEADRISGHELSRRLPEGRKDELGRLARAFNRLLARVQAASREQEQFIADASHELKTPVMAIEGHARILSRVARSGDLARLQTSAAVVERESHRMALTLRELLELAEANATDTLREVVRLDLVAEDALREIQATAPARLLRSDTSTTIVVGDTNRVRELLVVLLDNAIKYSPSDRPVDLTVTQSPRDGPIVRIRDYGPGLTDADRASVFGRFARGSAAAGVPGSGLGLAIARTIAERHHATLSLTQADGGGTIAQVRFPAAEGHQTD